jgi:hypothetical protein
MLAALWNNQDFWAARALPIVLAAALALTGFARPVLSAPLTEETRQFIEQKMFIAMVMGNARKALEICREADQQASNYDRDPFYDGAIARCLGYAEMHLNSQRAACNHFARAAEGLQAVSVDHRRHSEVIEWLDWLRRDRAKLGC